MCPGLISQSQPHSFVCDEVIREIRIHLSATCLRAFTAPLRLSIENYWIVKIVSNIRFLRPFLPQLSPHHPLTDSARLCYCTKNWWRAVRFPSRCSLVRENIIACLCWAIFISSMSWLTFAEWRFFFSRQGTQSFFQLFLCLLPEVLARLHVTADCYCRSSFTRDVLLSLSSHSSQQNLLFFVSLWRTWHFFTRSGISHSSKSCSILLRVFTQVANSSWNMTTDFHYFWFHCVW